MGRGNRADAAHRTQKTRKYRSGVRSLEDRITLSATPGSGDVDDLLTPGAGPDPAAITVQATGAPEATSATTTAWYSSVSSAWFTTLSTSSLGGGGSAVQSTSGSTGTTGGVNDPTIDPASYSEWIVRLSAAALQTIDSVDEAAAWLSNPSLGLSVIAGLGLPGQLLIRATGAIANVEQYFAGSDAFAYFEANRQVSVQTTPNDSSYGQLYGLHNTGQSGGTVDADIDAPEAWDIATGSRSIVVGVIDTGIDWTHPDLAANIWTNPGEIAGDGIDNDANGFVDDVHGYDFVNNDGNPMDDHYHGTHVAGTIGGVGNNGSGVVGLNWAVSMMGLKFLSSSGSGTTANAVRAVNYATMMRTTYGVNIRLTSNSWGGGVFDQGLLDAINAGGAADILFVAAAGNSSLNTDTSPQYPAAYNSQYIVSVAATDHNDALASFSNYGATTVDLAAPGVNTYSTSPGNSYRTLSGTSMATPHVSGVAALALSVDPTLSALQLKSKLLENVDVIPGLAGKTATSGRLNAYKVLSSLGLTVAGTTPAIGSTVTVPPTSFTVNVNHAYNASSVQASDFTVNGIAASGFALTDADTITFTFATSPVTAQGVQTMAMAAGAITRASDGGALAAFSGTFRYDAMALSVVGTTPTQGSLASLPLTTLDIQFNEAVAGASIGTGDLTLSQGTVTGATLLNSTTARYTLSGLANEGTFSFTLIAGAVTDVFGNGGAAYSGSVSLDIGTVALPAVAPVGLTGSLAYQTTFTGSIGAAGDEDRLTIAIDAGQRFTVQLDAAAGLTAQIEVRDPTDALVGTATATGAGLDAVLQNLPIGAAGIYTIVVRGAAGSTGTYTVRAVLNSAVESENHNGPANGTPAAAQELDTALVTLSGSAARASVLGRRTSSSDADWYALSLAAGQNVSAMLRVLGTGTAALRLTDAAGTTLAGGAPNNAKGTIDFHGFTAATGGTYYLEVSGSTSLDYQLVVGRNTEFDRGGNIATASAQTLAAASGALIGNLDGGASIGRLYVYDNAATRIREIDKTSGATISTFVSPVTTSSGPDFGLATTPASILVGGSSSSPIYELDANSGTVIRTIGASGISISGLAYRNGEIFVRTDSNNTITVLDYVTGNVLRTFTITSSSESLAAGSDYLYASSAMTLYTINPQTGATVATTTLPGSGFIEGLGVIGNEIYASIGSSIQVFDRMTFTLLRTITGQGDLEAIGADGGTTSSGDFYRVSLASGVAFQARTGTPADGVGEYVNLLDAKLSLYDILGNLVASNDNSAGDGRNALLNYTPAAGGNYYLVIEPSAPGNPTTSRGEYLVLYSGASSAAAPFQVAAVTPAHGANLATSVSQVTLRFSGGVLLSSVAASDLQVDGVAAASYTAVDGSTIQFTLVAPLVTGTHTVTLAGGAILDLQQTPVAAFTSVFTVDAAPPRVVSSSIQQNDVLAAGGLTYVVTFDDPMLQSNLDASDFTLRGNFRSVNYAASGFSYDAAGTTLTVTYAALPEDSYTLTLLSGDGRFEDATGNNLDGEPVFPLPPNRSGNGTAGGDFVLSFSLDAPATTLQAPAAVMPAGGLTYQSSAPYAAVIGAAGDVDELTIDLDAGQTLSVVATASAALRMSLEILGPGGASLGTATASVAGQTLLVQTLPVAVGGTYRLRLAGAGSTTGLANVSITLNAALEGEANGGAANNTIATAQNLEASFLALAGGGSRGAVIGKLDAATSGSTTLAALDSGWYDFTGKHTSTNANFIAGIGSSGEHHNFFVFDLTSITSQVASAQLRLANPSSGYTSPDASETYSVFDVSTPIAQLLTGGTGLTAIYNDLGTGAGFGSKNVSSADNGQTVTVELNSAATAMLNSGRGGQIALGGNLTTLSGTASQYIFGYSSGTESRQLVLTYGNPEPDYYSFTLAAGESATVGLKHLVGSGATLTIRDAAGNVLASGLPGSGSFDQVAANFTPTTTGTYYVAVASSVQNTYELVVTRNSAFDNGANASLAAAQSLGAVRNVLGYATAGAGDYYSFVVAAGTTLALSTSTPGDDSGQFVNNLDPAIELYDGSGNLLAANADGAADGRNALLSRAVVAGTYKARVLATSGQGEYLLQIVASASAPPSIAPISDAVTLEGQTATVEFTVTDADTPAGSVNVSATAADGTLLPAGGLIATHLGGGQWRLQAAPAADRFGSTTVTVQASDGQSTTTRQFTLTVTPVNDAPTFTKGADQSVVNTAGLRQVVGWAGAISAGPNEANQILTFLTSNDNPALFTAPPAIMANGTLTYTLSGVLGTATVTVRLRDSGGTAYGGADTSAPQTFKITVNASPATFNLDSTFDLDGRLLLPSTVGSHDVGRDVARQADGKYLMLNSIQRNGTSSAFGTSALTRFNADGSLDTGFGDGGTVEFADYVRVFGLEVRSDGKILVGGSAKLDIFSARLNSDGSFDDSYGTGGIGIITALTTYSSTDTAGTALQADGKLIVTRESDQQILVARFNTDGTADIGFNGTGFRTFAVPGTTVNTPRDVVVQSDGKIVAIGHLNSSRDFFAVRFNADGSIDTTFGPSGNGYIVIAVTAFSDSAYRAAVQSDDKIVIAGSSQGTDFGLVRLTAGGLLDTTFSGDGIVTTHLGGNEELYALTIQADGKIVVGGSGTGSSTDFAVARYLANGSLDPTFDGDGMKKFSVGSSDNAMYGLWYDPDGKLVFTGRSSDAANGNEAVIGRLLANGSLDASFNATGTNQLGFGANSVLATKTIALADGRILVGGDLTDGATPTRSVVWRLTADGALDTTFGNGGYWTSAAGTISGLRSMAIDSSGRILVVEQSGFRVTRLTADGQIDPSFTVVLNSTVGNGVDLVMQADDGFVVAGQRSGDLSIARYTAAGVLDTSFDGDGWTTVNLGSSTDTTAAVAFDPAGKIVVAGNANNDFGVIRLNTDGSLDTSFSGDGIFLQTVLSAGSIDTLRGLDVHPDGKIMLVGRSSSLFALMRLTTNGTLDTSFSGDGIATSAPTTGINELSSVKRQADGKLVGVGFGSISGVGQIVVARYLNNGSLDTSFDGDGIFLTNVGAVVSQAKGATLQPDGKLVVVGHADVGPRFEAAVLRYRSTTATLDAPSASPIADRSTRTGVSAGPIDFAVAHTSFPPTSLTVTVSSGNTAVVPNENLALVNLGGGNWRLTATPTDLAGSSLITVRVNDGTLTYAETFTLTAVSPATVTGVYASGSGWNSTFLDYLDSHALGHASIAGLGFRITTESQLQTLPWSNLDTLTLQFDGPVVVGVNDLTLVGSTSEFPPPAATGFTWNPTNFTATWTFAAPLPMNKYLLHLDPAVFISADGADAEAPSAAPPFDFRFNTLPGDADASSGVTFGEIGQMRLTLGYTAATPGFNPRYDWDGSGSVTFADVGQARARLGTSLGSLADPAAPASTGAASLTSDAGPEAFFSTAAPEIAPPWSDPAGVASFDYVAASDESTGAIETQYAAATEDFSLVRETVLIVAEGTRRSPAVGDLLRASPTTPIVTPFSLSTVRRLIARAPDLVTPTVAENWSAHLPHSTTDLGVEGPVVGRGGSPVIARPAVWQRLRRTQVSATVATEFEADDSTDTGE